MLNLMRKHARNWMMKVILGIIIVVFVFYFGSMGNRQRAERIAVIDGKPIVYADYQREYQNLVDMYRQRFGAAVTEEVLNRLNLRQQALDNLITQAVLVKKAEEMDIQISDEDVKALILAYPGFQRNGAFDRQTYEMSLRQFRMTPEEFEKKQKEMLTAMSVEDLIQDAVRVSDEEVYDFYRMQNEKIDLDFLLVPPQRFYGSVKSTPAELEAYLKSHEDRFRVPEQVQVKYLAFSGADYAASAPVSEAGVVDYYDRHKDRWMKDGKVRPLAEVRGQIAMELAQVEGMYKAADAAKKAHDTIYMNENFDAYATENRLPVRTTGLFRLTNPPAEFAMIPDFAKELISLQKNELGRVLQGEKAYYVVMVADRKAPYVPTLSEIAPEVERIYREEEAGRLAKQEAETLLARLKKGESLPTVARDANLTVAETGFFQPGGAIPRLGAAADLTEALYTLSEKHPYPERPYLVDGSYALLRFKERGKVDDAAFAAQKDGLAKALERQKKTAVVQAWVEGTKNDLVAEGRLKLTRNLSEL